MKSGNNNEGVKFSALDNYNKIDRNRKRGGTHAQDYMRLIAQLLRSDFTEAERFRSDLLGMDDIACKFDDYANAIDNGVDNATAVKNFTNSLGITTNNRKLKYDKEQAFKEIKILCCNYFKWVEDGVEIKKTCKNKALNEMSPYEKSLLPKPPISVTFHLALGLSKAIENVARKHGVSSNTLNNDFIEMRKGEQKEQFEIYRKFLRLDAENDAESKDEEDMMINYIDALDFDDWRKKNKFGSDFYVGLSPLDEL